LIERISPETREELSAKVAENMREEEEAFRILGEKMDRYQELLAACDRVPPTDANREITTSCGERLKTLAAEIGDLSTSLERPK
jgi:hypothetical protein